MTTLTQRGRPGLMLFWRTLLVLLLSLNCVGTTLLAQGDAATHGQQAVVEIVRLQHREASTIRAAITPLLDARGAINQIDNNLIISTSRANLARLHELIDELDVPRRQLLINVDFNYIDSQLPSSLFDGVNLTSLTIEDSEEALQSIIVTEGDYAQFSRSGSAPTAGLKQTEIGALLRQSPFNTQSFAISAQPHGAGDNVRVDLFIATLHTELDATGAPVTSVINSTLNIPTNQWQIISTNDDDMPLDNVIPATAQRGALAVRVELVR